MASGMGRWGGLAGVAAGVMFGLSGVFSFIAPPHGAPGSFGDYLIEVVVVVGFALAMVAIAGLHAAQSRSGRYGRHGAVGSSITFIVWWISSTSAGLSFE
jgi:hypothetical protein